MELSIGQQFEIERFSRAIDATADPEALKAIAKQLLQAWHTQKAATNWVIGQQLGMASSQPSSPSVTIPIDMDIVQAY
jgi:hypothetical protein